MDWREGLADYLAAKLPSAQSVAIARVGPMPAGASNATAAIDLSVRCGGEGHLVPLVLRPERQEGILAPYDIHRQYRTMRALSGTSVPVPTVVWYEPSPEILGAPFFLMHRLVCETLPLFWYGGSSPRLSAAASALATVHAVDWRGAGLDFLLPGETTVLPSPLLCEIPAWRVRAGRMGVDRLPLFQALDAYLVTNEPADARHALVHGDPNPGNYLFRGDKVVAVVDWELAAIGDPRADLGFYAALAAVFGGGGAGEPGRSVLSDAYESVTGRSLENLAYYEAFGLYRMLIVMAGWVGGSWGYFGADALQRRLDFLLGPGWARTVA
jgi:aminoglycoside phosphotransferase (APT) family kinase protein